MPSRPRTTTRSARPARRLPMIRTLNRGAALSKRTRRRAARRLLPARVDRDHLVGDRAPGAQALASGAASCRSSRRSTRPPTTTRKRCGPQRSRPGRHSSFARRPLCHALRAIAPGRPGRRSCSRDGERAVGARRALDHRHREAREPVGRDRELPGGTGPRSGRESVTSFSNGFVGSGLSRPLIVPPTCHAGDHLAVLGGGRLGLGARRRREVQRLGGLEDVVVVERCRAPRRRPRSVARPWPRPLMAIRGLRRARPAVERHGRVERRAEQPPRDRRASRRRSPGGTRPTRTSRRPRCRCRPSRPGRRLRRRGRGARAPAGTRTASSPVTRRA